MHTLLQDLRFTFRMLAKAPAFTAIAVLTLALGIGANTAIFTAAYATLAGSVPFDSPERLITVSMGKRGKPGEMEASYPNFRDWRARSQSFEAIAGYSRRSAALAGDDGPEMVDAPIVSADFFQTLGVNAAAGRTFSPDEDQPTAARAIVLSNALWQKRFGGRREIVGQQITVNNEAHTVIGVLPPDFQFAPVGTAMLFQQPPQKGPLIERRNLHWFNVVARLKPGVSLEQARSEMNTLSAQLEREFPDANAGTVVNLAPLRDAIVGQVRPVILLLIASVGVVLLICCANVANLQLARSAARQKEIAIRVALGATRGRIVRQVLTESVLLAAAGGAAGLAVALWVMDLLTAGVPASVLNFMPYLQSLGVDKRALLFTASVSLAAGVLFGTAPAWQLSSQEPQAALKEGGRGAGGPAGHRLRDVLVAAEIAISATLLIGAGLLAKSVYQMLRVDPGFNQQNLLTVRTLLPPQKYRQPAEFMNVSRELQERLARLPGVTGAAHTSNLPLTGGGNTVRFRIEGQPAQSAGEQPEAMIRVVSNNAFSVLGVPIIRGRSFSEQDGEQSPKVVIVNRELERQMFAGNAVGKRLTFTFAPDQPAREIVGVINDLNETALDAPPRPSLYLPYAQGLGISLNMVVRTSSSDPQSLAAAVRREIHGVDKGIAIMELSTMQRLVAESQATFLRRYPAMLTGAFAALAILLAMTGIYGVVAHSVAQRTHELGVRIALGARPRDVLQLMMSRGMRLALVGLAAGAVGGLLAARVISKMLFGVQPTDLTTFAAVLATVVATALVASYLPARRATRVDPMVALRYE